MCTWPWQVQTKTIMSLHESWPPCLTNLASNETLHINKWCELMIDRRKFFNEIFKGFTCESREGNHGLIVAWMEYFPPRTILHCCQWNLWDSVLANGKCFRTQGIPVLMPVAGRNYMPLNVIVSLKQEACCDVKSHCDDATWGTNAEGKRSCVFTLMSILYAIFLWCKVLWWIGL